jgi:hypothetical protein
MQAYRVFLVSHDGRISGPAHVIECSNDQEAMGRAVQYTNGKSAELWNGARRIACFPSDKA